MRTLIIAALLAAPALASADPLAVHATPAPDAPRTYFAPGIALGSSGNHTMAGATFEIGERISDHLVLHVEGLGGGNVTLDGNGYLGAVTGGVDATTCNKLEKVCAYAGFSAGFAAGKFTESDWFDPGSGMATSTQGATGVLRAGLDIGSKHVRWRPGIEAALFGPSQGAITNSIAFAF